MNKDQTLSHTTGRVSFKELQQIIKMGLVQGNLIPAFAGAWLAIVMTNHSFLSSIPQILLMLVGSTLIMGGACALNNYYDQDIDRIMPSKQGRPTVNDRISDRNLLMLSFWDDVNRLSMFILIKYTFWCFRINWYCWICILLFNLV